VLIAVLKIGSITSNGSRTWKRVLRIFSWNAPSTTPSFA
jgi:hypothetical protein